jgi:hypothetical protein
VIAIQAADPCPDPLPAPPASSASSNLAIWVLAAALLAVLVFDVWAGRTHRPTISQWMRRTFGRHRWWRPAAISLIGLTLWHMFFGGPL